MARRTAALRVAHSIAWAMALAGCAGSNLGQEISSDRQVFEDNNQQVHLSQTEGMLEKTGFKAHPANTPERQRQLLALPPYQIVAQAHPDGTMRYVFADAAVCDCLYVGDEGAYRRYSDLNQAQDMADDLGMLTGGASEAAVYDAGTWETATQ